MNGGNIHNTVRFTSNIETYSIGDRTVLPCGRSRIVDFSLGPSIPIPRTVADCHLGVRRILRSPSMAALRLVREENIFMDSIRDTGDMVD